MAQQSKHRALRRVGARDRSGVAVFLFTGRLELDLVAAMGEESTYVAGSADVIVTPNRSTTIKIVLRMR